MPRRTVPLILLCLCALPLQAQDLENVQIHGFVTQGFLFSSSNNYLSMTSSSGSAQWTEGAISVSNPVTEKLRVGMQLHMYQLGQFGGSNVQVDWASGDYRFNDHLGVRVGKIKTPLGLFNDSQDVDSLFLWVLLPKPCIRSTIGDLTWPSLGANCTAVSPWVNVPGACYFRGMPATAPSIAMADTPSNWRNSD
jgi:hypothetical protein